MLEINANILENRVRHLILYSVLEDHRIVKEKNPSSGNQFALRVCHLHLLVDLAKYPVFCIDR